MRKLLTPCLCAALTFAASNAFAINNGSWNLNSGLQNGSWQEMFLGGGPGQPGNILSAQDAAPQDQWQLSNLILQSVSGGPSIWSTIYSGGQIVLSPSALWGAGSTFTSLTALNQSSSNPTEFEISMTGFNVDGQKITVMGKFADNTQNYRPIWDPTGAKVVGHAGTAFNDLSVTISSVPDTGSTLALLCPALVGLAAWRRKH